MAVRFKGDTTFILWIAAIGAFVLAAMQTGLVFWRLIDGWFGPF